MTEIAPSRSPDGPADASVETRPAGSGPPETPLVEAEVQARFAAGIALAERGEDVAVLDLRGIAGFTDFFVVATASSERRRRTIVDAIERRVRERFGRKPVHIEGYPAAGWLLADYVDFLVHIFSPESRELYRIERPLGRCAPLSARGAADAARRPATSQGGGPGRDRVRSEGSEDGGDFGRRGGRAGCGGRTRTARRGPGRALESAVETKDAGVGSIMGARTLIFLLAVGVVSVLLLAIVEGNQSPVLMRLPFFAPLRIELWKIMLGALGLGAAAALALDTAGRTRRLLRERRLRRGGRDVEEGARLYQEGLEQMASGRWSDALLSLEAAREYEGDHPDVLKRLAECFSHLGRNAEAVAALEDAAAENRSDRAVAYALAEALRGAGEAERARALLARTTAEDPEPPIRALGRLRDLQRDAGEIREALATQHQILTLAPPSERAAEERRMLALRHAQGRSLLEAGEAAEAVQVFRGIVLEDPGAIPAWVRLGEAWIASGNEKEGIRAWEQASSRPPERPLR